MTGISKLAEEFANQLRNLTGKRCWAVYAGESTGSDVDMAFGKKIPRTVPLLNPHLTDEQRYYDAEMSLFIECTWRLDREGEVVCGSIDSNLEEGPMLAGLKSVVGKTVESVKIETPVFDLTVRLSGNLVLKIFCDQTSGEDDNYSIHVQDKVYIVGPRGVIRCEAGR